MFQKPTPYGLFVSVSAKAMLFPLFSIFEHPFLKLLWPNFIHLTSTLFTLCYCDHTIIITQSHSSILSTCFTSSLEPASHIAENSSSELFIPLAATFISTYRFNLLHAATPSSTFVILFHKLKTYLFMKCYPPPKSVFVCRTDLMALDRSPDLFAHRFYVLVLFFLF